MIYTRSPAEQLEAAHKAYIRGGQYLFDVFQNRDTNTHLAAEIILSLYNTYGIPSYHLKLLVLSHGCTFDEDKFIRLLEEQELRLKTLKACCKDYNEQV